MYNANTSVNSLYEKYFESIFGDIFTEVGSHRGYILFKLNRSDSRVRYPIMEYWNSGEYSIEIHTPTYNSFYDTPNSVCIRVSCVRFDRGQYPDNLNQDPSSCLSDLELVVPREEMYHFIKRYERERKIGKILKYS
jgi:hypothetical protein